VPDILFLRTGLGEKKPLLFGFEFLQAYDNLSNKIKSKCKIFIVSSSDNLKYINVFEKNPYLVRFLQAPLIGSIFQEVKERIKSGDMDIDTLHPYYEQLEYIEQDKIVIEDEIDIKTQILHIKNVRANDLFLDTKNQTLSKIYMHDIEVKNIFIQNSPCLDEIAISYSSIEDLVIDNLKVSKLLIARSKFRNFLFLQDLTVLASLELIDNQISDISFLQHLTSLKSLKIDNQISDISFLQNLTTLTSLDLSSNQISDISSLSNLKNLTELNLESNQISDISSLSNLTNLKKLDLGSNKISDYSFLSNLKNLTELNLESNQISDYSFLLNLTNLTELNLGSNKISDISYLSDLTNLTELNLENNEISDISSLLNLTNLTELNLENNEISDISSLLNLTNLTELNLEKNQISDISSLLNLTNLTELNLEKNQISDISSLSNLTNLTKLNLENNEISDISSLSNLTALTSLDLSNNQILDISLKNFEYLAYLYLSLNPLQSISLINFPKITKLNLGWLKLNKVELHGFINLIDLNLANNQILDISLSFLRYLPQLEELRIYGNPIKNIPKEIFDKEYENVLDEVCTYLKDIEKQGEVANKEIKVIFIGNGSVGKTQVAKRLCEKNFVFDAEHNSTQSIDLLSRKLADFELNCWDFAGQDVYHATHRLFMQTRALFVLVWDFENEQKDFHEWKGKKYENEKLRYWLEYAKCFAPESPILVLQNKTETEELSQKLYFEYEEKLKNEYPILDFLQVSAKTGTGFKVMERVMKKTFQENTAFQTPPLPTNWVAVRKAIREKQEKATEKTISIEDFVAICTEKECSNSVSTILGYLHDTGVLYYREDYFQNQIILNQDWAIEAIYKILNRESEHFEILKHENGKLDYELISEIWEKNTDAERKLFIDFMLSAELCFETSENEKYDTPFQERTFAIPQLLSSQKANNILTWESNNKQNVEKEEILYRFLPKVFIQRFIVKASHFSEVSLIWQKGLLLKTAQGLATVEASYEKGKEKIIILSESKLVTDKIKEELKGIANESTAKVIQGKTEGSQEKFGLAGLSSAKNKDVNQKSYNQDKEKEGIEKIIDLLLDKKSKFEQAFHKTADASIKFSLEKDLEELGKEIEEYRKKLED
jgi:internalin A